jgi:hypothetical protein
MAASLLSYKQDGGFAESWHVAAKRFKPFLKENGRGGPGLKKPNHNAKLAVGKLHPRLF